MEVTRENMLLAKDIFHRHHLADLSMNQVIPVVWVLVTRMGGDYEEIIRAVKFLKYAH